VRALPLAILLTVWPQDPSPVKDLLSMVGDKDSAASHRAIAALADLPEAGRKEAEAAAASLPPYWRDVLQSELKMRAELGDASKTTRVTFSGEGGPLKHLGRLPLLLAPGNGVKDEALGSIAVDFRNAPAMEALGEILIKSRQVPRNHGGTRAFEIENFLKWIADPHSAGQFMLFPLSFRFRERVDFSGATERVAKLELLAVADPAARVATWRKDVRLVEAETDTGGRLTLSTRKPATSVREFEEWIGYVSRNPSWDVEIPLVVNDFKAATIKRLRITATARVARRSAEFSLEAGPDPEKPWRAANAEFEISLTETPQADPEGRTFTAFIRPLKMKSEELQELPLMFEPSFRGGTLGRCYFKPKLVRDGVEYQVTWYTLVSRWADGGRAGALQNMKLTIPLDLIDRPVHAEFRDISLK